MNNRMISFFEKTNNQIQYLFSYSEIDRLELKRYYLTKLEIPFILNKIQKKEILYKNLKTKKNINKIFILKFKEFKNENIDSFILIEPNEVIINKNKYFYKTMEIFYPKFYEINENYLKSNKNKHLDIIDAYLLKNIKTLNDKEVYKISYFDNKIKIENEKNIILILPEDKTQEYFKNIDLFLIDLKEYLKIIRKTVPNSDFEIYDQHFKKNIILNYISILELLKKLKRKDVYFSSKTTKIKNIDF